MSQIVSSAGYHGEGRLARKATNNQLSRITTELPPLLMFACGWKHNVFLTKEKEVYVCGENNVFQNGPGPSFSLTPIKSEELSLLSPIWVSCGDQCSAFLNDSGTAFVCGSGWGPNVVELVASTSIVFINCGVSVVCGIGYNGEFFLWKVNNAVAERYGVGIQFCDCAAGANQIFALATNGVLYSKGSKKSCGQGKKWSSTDFVPVASLNGIIIKRVFAYFNHSVAIDIDGKAYSCGVNGFGELGIGDVKKTNQFTRISVFDNNPVLMASLGDTFTAFITENHELYTCGDGDEYRLCNTHIRKVYTPSLADAALGRKIMWISAGCSHILIAENLESVPPHYGRVHFSLDSEAQHRRKLSCSQFRQITVSKTNTTIQVDTSEIGSCWSGFHPNDKIWTDSGKKGIVIGSSSKGIVAMIENEYVHFESNSVEQLRKILFLSVEDQKDKQVYYTRSLMRVEVDTSYFTCQAFGFAGGDIVKHSILGQAKVVGVFGGSLWLSFDDDHGFLTTSINSTPEELHRWLEIIRPNQRSIKYYFSKNARIAVETSPCSIMNTFGLKVEDLVEFKGSFGIIRGTFTFFVVVEDSFSQKIMLYHPSSIKPVRRFSSNHCFISYQTIEGDIIDIDVSCNHGDKIMPNDRIMIDSIRATVVGWCSGLMWVQTDESHAIGKGVGYLKNLNDAIVTRRISESCMVNGYSVDTSSFIGLPMLPDDIVLFENQRCFVLGRNNDDLLMFNIYSSRLLRINLGLLSNIDVTYRPSVFVERFFPTEHENIISISVSTSEFFAKKVLPEDVISTPKGIGLVVGLFCEFLCVQIDKKPGVTFFSFECVHNSHDYFVIERRSHSINSNRISQTLHN